MFLRIDKLQVEMPAPTEPDPNAAAAVQELLGGRFDPRRDVSSWRVGSPARPGPSSKRSGPSLSSGL